MITLATLQQTPAGTRHIALLDEYLRQPRRTWQAGQLLVSGPNLVHASLAGRGGTRVQRHRAPMVVRQRLALQAAVIERQARGTVMQAARAAEQHRRQHERAGWLALPSPLASLAADLKRGSLPTRYAAVSEQRRIDTGDRHYLTFQLESRGWQVWLERLYSDYASEQAVVRSVMQHPGKGGATLLRAPSSVSAPSIRASRRQAVSDSHDARPAKDRGSARPYSKRQLASDVRSGHPRGYRAGQPEQWQEDMQCRTITVSSSRQGKRGTKAALAAAVGAGRQWQPFSAPRSEGRGKRQAAAVSAAESRRARARAAAGTVRMGEQD